MIERPPLWVPGENREFWERKRSKGADPFPPALWWSLLVKFLKKMLFSKLHQSETLNYSFSCFQLNSLTQHHWYGPVSAAGSLETSHTSAPTFLTRCLLPSWARHWAGVQKILSWWKEVYIHLKETHSTAGPNIWGMKSPLVIFIGWMLEILLRYCQGCMWKEEEEDPICSFWTFLERLTHITKKQEKPKNEWPHIAGRERRRSGA